MKSNVVFRLNFVNCVPNDEMEQKAYVVTEDAGIFPYCSLHAIVCQRTHHVLPCAVRCANLAHVHIYFTPSPACGMVESGTTQCDLVLVQRWARCDLEEGEGRVGMQEVG